MKNQKQLPTDLVEEYKLCQQKATSLSDNIWKTALILGVGSVAGIVALSGKNAIPDGLKPWLLTVLSLFAIGILLAWHRLARRWWSIQHTMFRRMEHIEKQSLLRANLYVAHLDKRVEFSENDEEETYNKPFLHPDLCKDLKDLKDYEVRGIEPMMQFVIETNIAAWVAFALFSLATLIPKTTIIVLDGPTLLKLIAVAIFTLGFFWRLTIQWRKC